MIGLSGVKMPWGTFDIELKFEQFLHGIYNNIIYSINYKAIYVSHFFVNIFRLLKHIFKRHVSMRFLHT